MEVLELLNTVATACGAFVVADKAVTIAKKHGTNVKDRVLKLSGTMKTIGV